MRSSEISDVAALAFQARVLTDMLLASNDLQLEGGRDKAIIDQLETTLNKLIEKVELVGKFPKRRIAMLEEARRKVLLEPAGLHEDDRPPGERLSEIRSKFEREAEPGYAENEVDDCDGCLDERDAQDQPNHEDELVLPLEVALEAVAGSLPRPNAEDDEFVMEDNEVAQSEREGGFKRSGKVDYDDDAELLTFDIESEMDSERGSMLFE